MVRGLGLRNVSAGGRARAGGVGFLDGFCLWLRFLVKVLLGVSSYLWLAGG